MTNSASEEQLDLGGPPVGGRRAADPDGAEALDVLFRQHYGELLRLAVVMLGSREAAEDAVQDAFVALHRRWASLRDPAAAEAYLRSAVLNRSRSWIRRQVTERTPRPLALVPDHVDGPEVQTAAHDEIGAVVAVMRTLARRQREVLACRYVLELSVADTARLLGIGEGSVKTHTHRGLQALQQRIEVTR